jgi:hypothetical protein
MRTGTLLGRDRGKWESGKGLLSEHLHACPNLKVDVYEAQLGNDTARISGWSPIAHRSLCPSFAKGEQLERGTLQRS